MRIEISSTEAVRHFGDCLARIKYRGDHFVITRNDEAVAELVPAGSSRRATWAELEKVLEGMPYDVTFADDLEAVNNADQNPANPWD
jgi:antitoxin (DNA-binding transcriptional repressor) of toxin-antitoxin stability system